MSGVVVPGIAYTGRCTRFAVTFDLWLSLGGSVLESPKTSRQHREYHNLWLKFIGPRAHSGDKVHEVSSAQRAGVAGSLVGGPCNINRVGSSLTASIFVRTFSCIHNDWRKARKQLVTSDETNEQWEC